MKPQPVRKAVAALVCRSGLPLCATKSEARSKARDLANEKGYNQFIHYCPDCSQYHILDMNGPNAIKTMYPHVDGRPTNTPKPE